MKILLFSNWLHLSFISLVWICICFIRGLYKCCHTVYNVNYIPRNANPPAQLFVVTITKMWSLDTQCVVSFKVNKMILYSNLIYLINLHPLLLLKEECFKANILLLAIFSKIMIIIITICFHLTFEHFQVWSQIETVLPVTFLFIKLF